MISPAQNPPTRKPRSSSGWSPERRAKQSAMMRARKIWEKSTGPKTAEGKVRAAANSHKHGLYNAHTKATRTFLRLNRRFLTALNRAISNEQTLQRLKEKLAAHDMPKKPSKPQNELLKAAANAPLTLSARRALGTSMPAKAGIHGSRLSPGCFGGDTVTPSDAKILQNTGFDTIKPPMTWTVAALYRFVTITDLPALQAELQAACDANGISGTLLIAPEGVNGTIAGQGDKLEAMIDVLDATLGVRCGELKYSHASGNPFRRTKVRIKKEIITMAAPEADPTKLVGTYVKPEDWNDLISDPDVTVLDTRNDYETKIGIFKNAIDPDIETFTQFKDFVAEKLDPAKNKKVAMFCTGGIRCEKASSYMLAHGFEEVYHLQGGILKYLETIPADKSMWEGECFVFDRRVAVGHGLEEGNHDICYGCRLPLSQDDMAAPAYEKGVSCPHCIDDLNADKIRMLRERHRQFVQAAARA